MRPRANLPSWCINTRTTVTVHPFHIFSPFVTTSIMNSTVQVQPISQGFMSSSKNLYLDEKSSEYSQQQQLDGPHGCRHTHPHNHQGESENAQSSHRGCHTARLRALLVPAAVLAVFLTGLAAWLCYSSMMSGDAGLMEGLFRRAVDDGSSNGDSPFVKNKRLSMFSSIFQTTAKYSY